MAMRNPKFAALILLGAVGSFLGVELHHHLSNPILRIIAGAIALACPAYFGVKARQCMKKTEPKD
jgi:uncharacterized membrane protein YfcA